MSTAKLQCRPELLRQWRADLLPPGAESATVPAAMLRSLIADALAAHGSTVDLSASRPGTSEPKIGPAFQVSRVAESDKFGGTTYTLKVHFHTRIDAEQARSLLIERPLPPGPFPLQAYEQAKSIDVTKLGAALVEYGCNCPTGEMLSWWVGREVNRLLDCILAAKQERAVQRTTQIAAAHKTRQETTEPPLTGRWHHGQGHLVSGTIRVSRWDCDTNPPIEFRDSLLQWICDTLNEAVNAWGRKARGPGYVDCGDCPRISTGCAGRCDNAARPTNGATT